MIPEPTACSQCGCTTVINLGHHGNLNFYRCRACGWGWAQWDEPDDDPEESAGEEP